MFWGIVIVFGFGLVMLVLVSLIIYVMNVDFLEWVVINDKVYF